LNEARIALLFPGQGSQSVGMGKDLVEAYPEAARAFAEADEVLGFGLSRLCFEGPAEELTETRNAQPAILLHGLAALRVLQARAPVSPALVAGHSLGEFSAAAAPGALTFEDALRVVRRRGELMWEAGTRAAGTMAAVLGLDAGRVAEVCAQVSGEGQGVVVVANHNSPQQVVISGDVAAVEAAAEPLKAAGAKRVVPLKVSGAFHSPLMAVVQDEFAAFLQDVSLRDPSCGVVSNVEADAVHEAAALREGFVRQLVSPVRWHESVARILAADVGTMVEVGPGNVLTNLGSRGFPEGAFLATSDVAGIEKVLATLQNARSE
jgi:[acyl-carrier-protein] S-malonyltransferase